MIGTVRVDLHAHSHHSPDGRATISQLAERAAIVGLSGLAITDHNTLAGHPELGEVQDRFPRLWLIPGAEISTREGHLLVYEIGELPPTGRPVEETLDWVRRHGGHAIIPHPFRWSHGVGLAVARRLGVEGIETLNAHTSALANARSAYVAARRGLAGVGGSDAHRASEVGLAYTEFRDGLVSRNSLWTELAAGRCTTGGQTLSIGGRALLALRTGLLRASRGFRPI